MSESIEAETKPKKPRTQKQIEAFEKARAARSQKIQQKKELQPEVEEVVVRAVKDPQQTRRAPKITKFRIEHEAAPEPVDDEEDDDEVDEEPPVPPPTPRTPKKSPAVKPPSNGYQNFILFT